MKMGVGFKDGGGEEGEIIRCGGSGGVRLRQYWIIVGSVI